MKKNTLRVWAGGFWLAGSLTLFGAGLGPPADPLPAPYNQQSERGAHHRVVNPSAESEHAPPGSARSYVQLETGLHYWDGQRWRKSKELLEYLEGYGVARHGPQHVVFKPNPNTVAALQLTASDGAQLLTHVLGLGYFDAESGQSVLLAEIQDAQGEIHLPNQVVYPDCFDGLKADLRYTYTKAGLEQDVILRENPPPPEVFQLNPASTRLEVLTEVFRAPNPRRTPRVLKAEADPQRRQKMAEPDWVDERIEFGELSMGLGRAFAVSEPPDKQPHLPNSGQGTRPSLRQGASWAPVAKRWLETEGRQFVIEAVEYGAVREMLERLPGRPEEPGNKRRQQANGKRIFPGGRRLARAAGTQDSFRVAQAAYRPRGVVLDFYLGSSAPDFTFEAGRTYYLSGAVRLRGTTVIEEGAVLKFAPGASLEVEGKLRCPTFGRAILTAETDGTVGASVPASRPWPWYGRPALALLDAPSGTQIQNLEFRYAETGLMDRSPGASHQVRDCRFFKCRTGIESDGANVRLENVDMESVENPSRGLGGRLAPGEGRGRGAGASGAGLQSRSSRAGRVGLMTGDDHGDDSSSATSVSPGSSVGGAIDYGGDVDCFRVDVSSSGTLTVYTTGSTDTYGRLYTSSGGYLGYSDDNPYPNFRLSTSVSAGAYYVFVRHYSSAGTGPYTFYVEFSSSGGGSGGGSGSDDYGNSFSSAATIGSNASVSGAIDYGGDADVFRVDVSSSGTLSASTSGSTDTYGYLYDAAGICLTYNDDNPYPNFGLSTWVSAGTYYILVRHYSSGGTGAYTLYTQFSGSGGSGGGGSGGTGDDHGNSLSTATSLSPGSSIGGRIDYGGDEDYFRVNAGTGSLTAYTSGSTDTYGYLLDSSGNTLTSDDDTGVDFNFQFSSWVSAGAYYIRVRHYSSSGTGSYTLTVQASSPAPSAPTGLSATAGTRQVMLDWNSMEGATTYYPKRSLTGQPGSFTGLIATTSTTYTDTGLSDGATYYYVIACANSAGSMSPDSSFVSATTAPAPPTALGAYGHNGYVTLYWNSSPGTYHYRPKRSSTSGGSYSPLANVFSSTSYSDTSISPGLTYYYVVTASSVSGAESLPSNQASATTPPPAPTGLAARPGFGQVNLSWNAAPGATSYKVKRSGISGGPYTTVAYNLTSTSYLNTGLAASTTYYYVVSAANSAGESYNSTQVSVTTPSLIDNDHDGLPDAWEQLYFGNLVPLGLQDFDGDGLTNEQEYQGGTHPLIASELEVFTPLRN